MTQLFYTPSSGSILSTLQVVADNQIPLYYQDVTITSSSISIFVQSGSLEVSSILGTYPISNTTLYYPPFPTTYLPEPATTSSFIIVNYQFDVNYTDATDSILSGSGYSLTSGSTVYLTGSYYSANGSTTIETNVTTPQQFTAKVYGNSNSAEYQSALYVISDQGIPPANIVALVSGSNVSSSATFSLSPTASYTMYFIVTGSNNL